MSTTETDKLVHQLEIEHKLQELIDQVVIERDAQMDLKRTAHKEEARYYRERWLDEKAVTNCLKNELVGMV